MAVFENENIRIDLPAKWKVEGGEGRQSHNYHLKIGRGRQAFISFHFDSNVTTEWQYQHFHECFTWTESPDGRYRGQVTDPYELGPFSGFRSDTSFGDEPVSQEKACFKLAESVRMIDTHDLRPTESDQLWRAVSSLEIKPGYRERMVAEWNKPEKMLTFDATDLTRPRTKRMKAWMDHHMVLLHDAEADEWDAPTEGFEDLIVALSPEALFVTSQTEWGVTLEFTVRDRPPRSRRGDWSREGAGRLSLPSDRLIVEQTTGGGLLEIGLQPGDYTLTAHATFPPDADASDEGVERIKLLLTPV
ncbi:MAG: hypothetical protein AAFX76_04920 [Planctomycetota bacterium]